MCLLTYNFLTTILKPKSLIKKWWNLSRPTIETNKYSKQQTKIWTALNWIIFSVCILMRWYVSSPPTHSSPSDNNSTELTETVRSLGFSSCLIQFYENSTYLNRADREINCFWDGISQNNANLLVARLLFKLLYLVWLKVKIFDGL